MAKKYLCNISKMICMQNNNKITIICRQNDTDNMFYANDKNNVQAANKINVYANENNIRDLFFCHLLIYYYYHLYNHYYCHLL